MTHELELMQQEATARHAEPLPERPTRYGRASKPNVVQLPGGPQPGAYEVRARRWRGAGGTPNILADDVEEDSDAGSSNGANATTADHPNDDDDAHGEVGDTPEASLPEGGPPNRDSSVRMANGLGRNGKKRTATLLLVFGAIIVMAVGIALGVTSRSQRGEGDAAPTGTDPCQGTAGTQPDVRTQCDCFGIIEGLSDSTILQYETLRATLGLDAQEATVLSSCAPHNVALLLVATAVVDAAAAAATMATEQLRDRYALNLLYLAWDGPNWIENTGWLSSGDHGEDPSAAACTWQGITCDEFSSVVGLDLSGNAVNAGRFVSEVGLLTSLTALNLGGNTFTGPLPTELGLLTNLKSLVLEGTNVAVGSENSNTYGLPSELGLLTSLTDLELDMVFSDAVASERMVPSELGNLKELEMLKVAFGPRSSILPVELSRLTALVSFQARYGSIAGYFPFWNASGLVRLDVEECQLTGSIPSHELGRMTGLTWLSLFGNELTDPIPTEIGLLTDLEMLLLSGNSLNGTLPTEIGMCRALSTLAVITNDLSGTVPDDALGQLTELTDLTLHGNRFSGSIPLDSSSGLCALRRSGKLTSLYIDCSEISCDPSCCYCGR